MDATPAQPPDFFKLHDAVPVPLPLTGFDPTDLVVSLSPARLPSLPLLPSRSPLHTLRTAHAIASSPSFALRRPRASCTCAPSYADPSCWRSLPPLSPTLSASEAVARRFRAAAMANFRSHDAGLSKDGAISRFRPPQGSSSNTATAAPTPVALPGKSTGPKLGGLSHSGRGLGMETGHNTSGPIDAILFDRVGEPEKLDPWNMARPALGRVYPVPELVGAAANAAAEGGMQGSAVEGQRYAQVALKVEEMRFDSLDAEPLYGVMYLYSRGREGPVSETLSFVHLPEGIRVSLGGTEASKSKSECGIGVFRVPETMFLDPKRLPQQQGTGTGPNGQGASGQGASGQGQGLGLGRTLRGGTMKGSKLSVTTEHQDFDSDSDSAKSPFASPRGEARLVRRISSPKGLGSELSATTGGQAPMAQRTLSSARMNQFGTMGKTGSGRFGQTGFQTLSGTSVSSSTSSAGSSTAGLSSGPTPPATGPGAQLFATSGAFGGRERALSAAGAPSADQHKMQDDIDPALKEEMAEWAKKANTVYLVLRIDKLAQSETYSSVADRYAKGSGTVSSSEEGEIASKSLATLREEERPLRETIAWGVIPIVTYSYNETTKRTFLDIKQGRFTIDNLYKHIPTEENMVKLILDAQTKKLVQLKGRCDIVLTDAGNSSRLNEKLTMYSSEDYLILNSNWDKVVVGGVELEEAPKKKSKAKEKEKKSDSTSESSESDEKEMERKSKARREAIVAAATRHKSQTISRLYASESGAKGETEDSQPSVESSSRKKSKEAESVEEGKDLTESSHSKTRRHRNASIHGHKDLSATVSYDKPPSYTPTTEPDLAPSPLRTFCEKGKPVTVVQILDFLPDKSDILPTVPSTDVTHLLYVRPKSVYIPSGLTSSRFSSTEVMVKVSLVDEAPRTIFRENERQAIPAFMHGENASTMQLQDADYTVCAGVSSKSCFFTDTFKLRPPEELTKNLFLVFTVYHVTLKKKANPTKDPIAYAFVPLFSKEGALMEGTDITLSLRHSMPSNMNNVEGMDETKGTTESLSVIKIDMQWNTSFYSSNPMIQSFLDATNALDRVSGANSGDFTSAVTKLRSSLSYIGRADSKERLRLVFLLLNQFCSEISLNRGLQMDAFQALLRTLSDIQRTEGTTNASNMFNSFLSHYIIQPSSPNDKIETSLHESVMSAWRELLVNKDKYSKRMTGTSQVLSEFLFRIIVQSLMIQRKESEDPRGLVEVSPEFIDNMKTVLHCLGRDGMLFSGKELAKAVGILCQYLFLIIDPGLVLTFVCEFLSEMPSPEANDMASNLLDNKLEFFRLISQSENFIAANLPHISDSDISVSVAGWY